MRTELADAPRRRAPRGDAGRSCFEDDSLDVVSVAVPTFLHAPITIAALERGLHVLSREADRAHRRGGGARWSRRREQAGRVLDVAFNHRQRGDIQTLRRVIEAGPARAARTTRRRGGCGAPASRRSARGSPTPSTRAAGRWWTSASTCSTTRCSCSGSRTIDDGQRLHLRPARHGRVRRQRRSRTRPGGERRRSTSRTSRPRSCGSTTAARCSSRRAGPRTARPATSSGSRIYGTEGGAELRVVDMELGIGTLKMFTDVGGRAPRRRRSRSHAGGRSRRGRRAVPGRRCATASGGAGAAATAARARGRRLLPLGRGAAGDRAVVGDVSVPPGASQRSASSRARSGSRWNRPTRRRRSCRSGGRRGRRPRASCDDELAPSGLRLRAAAIIFARAVDRGQRARRSRARSVAATPWPQPISSTRSPGWTSSASTIARSRSLTCA